MWRRGWWGAALAAGFLYACPAHGAELAAADTAARERVVYQDTVRVRASKLRFRLSELATSASVISPREIRLGTARALQDAVSGVPGAHVMDLSGSDTQGVVEARGFAAQGQSSHVLVLVDEIPINDLEADRVDWNLLGLSQVSAIEFLRGPASFLYGNASMAGVVNLVTRHGGELPLWAEATGGSEGRAGGGGGVGWAAERHAGRLSGSYQQLDGFRQNSAWRAASGYASAQVGVGAAWKLRGRLLAHRGEQEVPGPLPDSTQTPEADWKSDPERSVTPDDQRDLTTWQGAVELGGPLALDLESVTLVSADLRDLDATETVIPVGALDRSSESRSLKIESRAHWRPLGATAPHLLIGGDLQHGTLESRYRSPGSDAVVGAGDVRRLSGGVFALAQLRPREDLAVTGGVRLDWLRSSLDDPTDGSPRSPDDDLRAVSPTLAASYALPRRGQLYASWAGAFKAPTLEQMYDRRPYDLDGPGPFPPLVISNQALQPQRGDHFEVGGRILLAPGMRGDLAAYLADSRDEIGFDLANFRHINIERSRHYGVESQLVVEGPAGTEGQVSYAHTRAKFRGGEHDDRQINTVPVHQLSARMSWEHRWGGSLSAEFMHVARQWIDEDERFELEPYVTVGVGARQAIGPVELHASVRNLFDELYATLGYVTLDELGNELPVYFPAARRSFQAGLRVGGGQ